MRHIVTWIRKISVAKKILAGFTVALLMLVSTGLISYQNATQYVEDNRWVAHTYEVIQELDAVLLTAEAAESSVRGYIITGNDSYLEAYKDAASRLDAQVNRVRELTTYSPNQQLRTNTLQINLRIRFELLQLAVDYRKERGFAPAQKLVSTGQGKVVMESVTQKIEEMKAEERSILAARSQLSDKSKGSALSTFSIMFMLDVFFLGLIYVITKRDLTQRKRVEDELQRERHLLHSLMDYLPDSIYFKDKEGKFTRINRALADSVGLVDSAEAVGKSDSDFFSEELAAASYNDEQEIIRTGRPILSKEEREVWPDGHETWVLTTKMPLRDAQGQITGTFGVSRDVTASKSVERLLQELATRDELTGLSNRRDMGRILDEEVTRYYRYGRPVSLVLLDIDHFKRVNDTYGHQVGDAVLKWIADILRESIRELDYSARYGGEEFAIILPETPEVSGILMAERLRKRIAAHPFRIVLEDKGLVEIAITASLGVAEASPRGPEVVETLTLALREALIARADQALYEAKRQGRNRTVSANKLLDRCLVAS